MSHVQKNLVDQSKMVGKKKQSHKYNIQVEGLTDDAKRRSTERSRNNI